MQGHDLFAGVRRVSLLNVGFAVGFAVKLYQYFVVGCDSEKARSLAFFCCFTRESIGFHCELLFWLAIDCMMPNTVILFMW
jgi:hypothetical protein